MNTITITITVPESDFKNWTIFDSLNIHGSIKTIKEGFEEILKEEGMKGATIDVSHTT